MWSGFLFCVAFCFNNVKFFSDFQQFRYCIPGSGYRKDLVCCHNTMLAILVQSLGPIPSTDTGYQVQSFGSADQGRQAASPEF